MNIEFIEDIHVYKADGKYIPSVTTILKENGLMDGLRFVNKDILDRACDFGTNVHATTELFDQGILDEENLDSALVPYLESWKTFLADSRFEILEIEEIVASEKRLYAGRVDRIGVIPNFRGKSIVEIKTSTSFNPASALQTSAYEFAYNENKPVKEQIKNRFVVHLTDNGYKIYPCTDRNDIYTFFGCLNVFNFKQKHNIIKERG